MESTFVAEQKDRLHTIDPERLVAKPWATFCLLCQEALDAGQ